jgi:carbon-monoxide dehydrogenase medium subunit
MKPFEYVEPETLGEALDFLERNGAECKALAGGTDLIVQLKRKLLEPKYIINLKKIKGLNSIDDHDGRVLRIGSLTTLSAIPSSKIIPKALHAICEAARAVGTPQIRNIATIGGNICNAAPSADLAPALIAFRARIKIRNFLGERIVPVDRFFLGPNKTCLASNELITEIEIPFPAVNSCSAYLWVPKYASIDETLVGCAVSVSLTGDVPEIQNISIGLGAVSSTPIRSIGAERFLKGKRAIEDLFLEAGRIAGDESKPIARFGISSEFRREMVRVLVARCLKKTVAGIKELKRPIHPK